MCLGFHYSQEGEYSTVRDVLSEMVRLNADLFPGFKITAKPDQTKFQGVDEGKTLILLAESKEPLADLSGEFGFNDIKLLAGLFRLPSYTTEHAKIDVEHETRNGKTFVAGLRFSSPEGVTSRYRACSPERMWAFTENPSFTWEVNAAPAKAKLAELGQLARLYSAIDACIAVRTEDGALIAAIGKENGSTHSTKLVLDPAVTGKLDGEFFFYIDKLLAVCRLAGDAPIAMRIANKGLMAIDVETSLVKITYILRGIDR